MKELTKDEILQNINSKTGDYGGNEYVMESVAIAAMTEYAQQEVEKEREKNKAEIGVYGEIQRERIMQDSKWGEQNHCPADWIMILGEEFGEVSKAALEAKFGKGTLSDYRKELIQVAAVAVAMVQCYDRNTKSINK